MKATANPNPRAQARQIAKSELQALIEAGLASGPAQPFNMQAFVAEQKLR